MSRCDSRVDLTNPLRTLGFSLPICELKINFANFSKDFELHCFTNWQNKIQREPDFQAGPDS